MEMVVTIKVYKVNYLKQRFQIYTLRIMHKQLEETKAMIVSITIRSYY